VKVQAIFSELVGERAEVLRADRFPNHICSLVTAALSEGASGEATVLHNDQIALNVVDWNSDAAFLVALHLFPERFTELAIAHACSSPRG
jgi:hypothetical protein